MMHVKWVCDHCSAEETNRTGSMPVGWNKVSIKPKKRGRYEFDLCVDCSVRILEHIQGGVDASK